MTGAPNNAAISTRLPLLDGLRGIAALAVFVYHMVAQFGLSVPLGRSYLFVDFFFLLSGFVLGLAAEPRLTDWRKFMTSRVRRLWPVIALGAVLGGAAMLGQVPLGGLAMSTMLAIALVPAFWQSGVLYPLNTPHWSLLLELLANLIHGLLLVRLKERTLWYLTAVFAVLLVAAIMVHGSNTSGVAAEGWLLGLPRVAFAYVLGVALARRYRAGAMPRFGGIAWLPALTLPLLCIAALDVFKIDDALGDIVVSVVLFPALFVLAIGATLPQAFERSCAELGRISYPLYATHMPVLWLAGRLEDIIAPVTFSIIVAPALALVVANRLEPRAGKAKKTSGAKPVQATA